MKIRLILIAFLIHIVVKKVRGCSNALKLPDENINKVFNASDWSLFIFDKFEDCATACLRVTRCAVVNYEIGAKTCLFWFANQKFFRGRSRSKKFPQVAMRDWKKVMKNDPCADRPCGMYERCVPNGSSYVCEPFCPCCNVAFLDHYGPYTNVSSVDSSSEIRKLSLTSDSGWMPKTDDPLPIVHFRMAEIHFLVKGIVIRGDESRQSWVTSYDVHTSTDCYNFTQLHITTKGCKDATNAVLTHITPPIKPKCLRILPKTHENVLSMRMDLVGCVVKY